MTWRRLARKIRETAAETWRSIFAGTSTEWGEPGTPDHRPPCRHQRQQGQQERSQ